MKGMRMAALAAAIGSAIACGNAAAAAQNGRDAGKASMDRILLAAHSQCEGSVPACFQSVLELARGEERKTLDNKAIGKHLIGMMRLRKDAVMSCASITDEPADRCAARAMLERAEAGDPAAMMLTAQQAFSGHGAVIRNEEAAWRMVEEAHKLGEPAAARLLAGRAFDEGKHAEAFRLHSIAAAKGDRESAFEAGKALLLGKGTARDAAKGRRMVEMAADDGSLEAMAWLGTELLLEGGPIETDKKAAIRMIEKAAHGGHPKAMAQLALLLVDGDDMPRDSGKAAWLAKSSADAGDILGLVAYGMMLIEGQGVQPKPEEGARALRLAADRGSKTAIEYLEGIGAGKTWRRPSLKEIMDATSAKGGKAQ